MKVKLLDSLSIVPTIAYEAAAGIDVYYPYSHVEVAPWSRIQLKLGIAIEIENDEVAIVSERSGHAIKKGLTSIGNIIDCDYRGEISIILQNNSEERIDIEQGEKIGQLVICKLGNRKIEIVEELTPSLRGENAHGSSGK